MSCITISQLYKKSKAIERPKGARFYTFKEFVTLHNEGKLDDKYYTGQKVCPTYSPMVNYLSLALIVVGAGIVGYAIKKASLGNA